MNYTMQELLDSELKQILVNTITYDPNFNFEDTELLLFWDYNLAKG